MLIDIITASYKSGKTLQRAIDSVQAQDHADWHLIVVDDASPDNSPVIAAEAALSDARITPVLKEKNEGLIASRNTGLEHLRGEWVAFLDGDDYYMPNHLTNFLKFHERHPDTEMFVGKPHILGDPHVPYYYDVENTMVDAREQAFEGSLFVKRSLINRVGVVFDPSDEVKVLGQKFYDRMVQEGARISPIAGQTCYYDRTGAQSITINAMREMQENKAMTKKFITHGPQLLPYLIT
ncbi:MAG: glycosyltransferase family 2 protein [Alphaproteobacteria bacterium]|nr:glycosyltransferase family 2 protein [Alphaproteobacteria bacterium]